MMGALGALADTEVSTEQMQKQLIRHQIPVAAQVESLVQMLVYQKSLIPQHVINPLIDSVIQHITSELTKLKIDEQASKKRMMDTIKQVEQHVNTEQLQNIENIQDSK